MLVAHQKDKENYNCYVKYIPLHLVPFAPLLPPALSKVVIVKLLLFSNKTLTLGHTRNLIENSCREYLNHSRSHSPICRQPREEVTVWDRRKDKVQSPGHSGLEVIPCISCLVSYWGCCRIHSSEIKKCRCMKICSSALNVLEGSLARLGSHKLVLDFQLCAFEIYF